MHVYHYAPYEVSAVRRLMSRYATREDVVDDMLRAGVFVDLFRVVREGFRIGEPAYSIKNIEHIYRGRREGAVADAGASIVAFERWIEAGEPRSWEESPILKAIRDYNEDDCVSTLQLADWLRVRQEESGIRWCPPRIGKEDGSEADKVPPEAVVAKKALMSRLLEGIPVDSSARAVDAERWRVQELLAHLLEFHRREEKPVWWAMFERHAMTNEELQEDINCLGGMVLESDKSVSIKKSTGYWYRFPDQDTKISAGARVYFAHDLGIKAEVEEMAEAGRVLVKLGPKAVGMLPEGFPPKMLNLIPDEYVSPGALANAVFDIVEEYAASGDLRNCLETFLFRQSPRTAGQGPQQLLLPGEGVVDGTVRVVRSLDGSTLCIQGPPGAGKTFVGSRVITELLADGRAVGVTSNSHKAIHNLLQAVGDRQGGQLSGIKVSDKDLGELGVQFPKLQCLPSNRAEQEFKGGLIAGTAWFYARPAMAGRLDYLFVDEAGQVSVANLVAMSRAARNLILLGDQMQLGQPTKGSHPGESGQSALAYLLQGHATIPEDLGIFLSTTWRLHPDVCGFISGAVYEGRLRPEPSTADRIILRGTAADRIQRESGLVFLPVEHEGNSQASDEEVNVAVSVAQELLGRRWVPKAGESRQLTIDDILFIAPYNMQVRRLHEALPQGARVGTIDKFQGQEAAVVVISMCSSAGETGPRGLSFLLDRNRLNVAISRAQSLAVVIGDPRIARSSCGTVADLEQLNLYCRILDEGGI